MLVTLLQWLAMSTVLGVNICLSFFPTKTKYILTLALISASLLIMYGTLTAQWGIVTMQCIMGGLNIYGLIKKEKKI